MVTPTRTSNDRLRTVWTPEMDRYFISLMLEQVNKGNRFDDHLFSKRAWKHMSALFNAKFKFSYGKDVLKNRHKTLRNLYRSVRSLLQEKGFYWDEKRQMVTADNCVWNEYLKVHPDARSLRIKSIPYYSDLCLIYGGEAREPKGDIVSSSPAYLDETMIICEGTQPNSTLEEASEFLDEISVHYDNIISQSTSMDDALAYTSISKDTKVSGRVRTSWHPPMDRYFIDLMLDQVRRGNQIEGVFRKQAWMEMIALFNAKFGFHYENDVLKNRYKTLRRQYNVIKNLLQLDGFAWDEARQMVTADDSVWQDYLKVHTDARQFMTRPVPYYRDLCTICSDTIFNDSDCFTGQSLDPESESNRASNGCQSPTGYISSEDENRVSNSKSKRKPENGSNTMDSKKKRGEEMVRSVSSLGEKNGDGKFSQTVSSIENVIAAVQTLPEMDEELILDACDLLEDEVRAKIFLALDVKLRKKWLLRKLRPQES